MFNSVSVSSTFNWPRCCNCDTYCPHCGRRKYDHNGWLPINPWPWYVEPPRHKIYPQVGEQYNPTRPKYWS